MYNLKSLDGSENMTVTRANNDSLDLQIGSQRCRVLTEDLAALIRQELPKDRAKDLFSEIETETVQQGKVRVAVEAKKDIRKGDSVVFTLDVTKTMGSNGAPAGLRVAKASGLLY